MEIAMNEYHHNKSLYLQSMVENENGKPVTIK